MCGYESVWCGRAGDPGEPVWGERARPGAVPPRRLVGLVTMTVLVAVGTASCGDDGDDDAASTTTTTGAHPPENETEIFPEDEAEQEVTDAYLAYWAMLDRLGQDPDPDDPEIEQRATGTALDEVRAGLGDLQEQGRRAQLGSESSHEVMTVAVTQDEATVTACSVEDLVITDTAGNPVETPETATAQLEATLVRDEGHWQVATLHIADSWPGAAECDEV